eukprot:m.209193 g.209193  ORF g.209193 m.209193 type:complete len:759 (-) comp22090_c1_seq4:961-3237(-)
MFYFEEGSKETRQWVEHGVGSLDIQPDTGILSILNENQDVLHRTDLRQQCDDVHTESNMLILWYDSVLRHRVAISFSCVADQRKTWPEICQVLGIDPASVSSASPGTPSSDEEDDPESLTQLDDTRYESDFKSTLSFPTLPPFSLETLEEISNLLDSAVHERQTAPQLGAPVPMTAADRDKRETAVARCEHFSDQCLSLKYGDHIHEALEMLEDLEDEGMLRHLARLAQALLLLGNITLLENLTSGEKLLDIIGAMDYLKDPPSGHRKFLTEEAAFREPVRIEDPQLSEAIHSCFRMQHLKDVIFANTVDDTLSNQLSTLLVFKSAEIVTMILSEVGFLKELFDALKSEDVSPEDRKNQIRCLLELCKMSGCLHMEQKALFMETLYKNDVLDIFPTILDHDLAEARLAGMTVLTHLVYNDATDLRMRICGQVVAAKAGMPSVMQLLVDRITEDPHLGMVRQAAEALRLLLDCGTPDHNLLAAKKTEFLNHFYDDCAPPLRTLIQSRKDTQLAIGSIEADRIEIVVDLVTHCVPQHGFLVKHFLLNDGMLLHIGALLSMRNNVVIFAVLRFLRAVAATGNEFFLRNIANNKLLAPVIGLLQANGPRYNLMNSAILDLLEFIRKENIKTLVHALVKQHESELRAISYVLTCRALIARYERNEELERQPPSSTVTEMLPDDDRGFSRLRKREGLDLHEDNYFDSADEDEPAMAQDPPPLQRMSSVAPRRPLPSVKKRGQNDDDDDDDAVDDDDDDELLLFL